MLKKFLLLLFFVFGFLCFIACNKDNSSEINDTGIESTNIIEQETIINSIDNYYNVYDMYGDYLWKENVFFVCDHYVFFDYSLAKSGKIKVHYDFIKILNEQADDSQVLYAAILAEDNGVGIYEFYDKYLKNSDIISEFSGKSDEEIQDLLKIKDTIEKEKAVNWEGNIKSEVIIYATKEQLLALNETECSKELAIYIKSIEWPLVELKKEDIENYNGKKIPVYYYINEGESGQSADVWLTKDEAITLLENENVYNAYWSYELIHNNPNWKYKE